MTLLSGIIINSPDFKIITGFFVLILLLFGSALMSGSEVAFFSLRPEDLEKFKNKKSKKASAVLKLYSNPEKLLSTILVANNTINIAVVLFAALLSSRVFDFSDDPVMGFLVQCSCYYFPAFLFW